MQAEVVSYLKQMHDSECLLCAEQKGADCMSGLLPCCSFASKVTGALHTAAGWPPMLDWPVELHALQSLDCPTTELANHASYACAVNNPGLISALTDCYKTSLDLQGNLTM